MFTKIKQALGIKAKTPPQVSAPLDEWGEPDFLEEFVRIQEMADTLGELEWLKDAKGWTKLGEGTGVHLSENLRRQIVKDARNYSVMNALVKQSMKLYTNYGVGTGIFFQARDESSQKILEEFWSNPDNRKFTSAIGQQGLSNSLLTDGEMPFALFEQFGKVTLRKYDPLEFVEVATDLEDVFRERFYVRKFTSRGSKDAVQTQILRDWRNEKPMKPGETSTGAIHKGPSSTKLPSVYFVKLQEGGIRGYSLFTAMLHWAEQHRQFMRARAAVTSAIASLAYKLKIKGGQTAINAAKAQLQSSLVTDTNENNPSATPGSTWIENANVDLSKLKQETGAAAAQVDGAMLLTMAGSAVGIFPHYFGAGESFRLATASAMELPMLKAFQAYSQQWIDIWRDVFNFVLEKAGVEEGDAREIDMMYPEITVKDVLQGIQAIDALITIYPDLVASVPIQQKALGVLGFKNPKEILEGFDIKRERPEDFGLPAFGGQPDKKRKEGEEEEEPPAKAPPITPREAAIMVHKILRSVRVQEGNGHV